MTTTAEVAVIEDDDVEVVETDALTKREATALNKKIQALSTKVSNNAFELLSLLEQAATGNIHKVLGYKSWTEWYSENVQVEVSDSQERKMLANMMSGKGMSQRAIAASLGVGQATVHRDLADAEGDSDESPAVTTGIDGKEYKRKPADETDDEAEVVDGEVIDAEVVEDEPALKYSAKGVAEAVEKLVDDINALLDFSELPGFVNARAKLAAAHQEDLEAVRDGVQDVLDKLFA